MRNIITGIILGVIIGAVAHDLLQKPCFQFRNGLQKVYNMNCVIMELDRRYPN